jgi:hypothetical protein
MITSPPDATTDGYRHQSEETEWVDDPRPAGTLPDENAVLRERYEQLREKQVALQAQLDSTATWGAEESYAELLESRLRLFYSQHLPDGAAHPDAKRALAHFGGNVAALNRALKVKYGADLDDACRSKPARSDEVPPTESSHRRPNTFCQCVADFVDAPASPFAAVGVRCKVNRTRCTSATAASCLETGMQRSEPDWKVQVGVKSKDFSMKKLHCGKGGACESVGEVGRALWEIPGSTVAGFSEGFKHTSSAVQEGPQMAVHGIETAFRHEPTRPRTEGYV